MSATFGAGPACGQPPGEPRSGSLKKPENDDGTKVPDQNPTLCVDFRMKSCWIFGIGSNWKISFDPFF